jgi:LmbE family N-acetylglucosaminyl deacetylase
MKILGVDQSCVSVDHVDVSVNYLDSISARSMTNSIETLGKLSLDAFQPEIVLIPTAGYHQDHRRVFEASFAACRVRAGWFPPIVLAYENPADTNWRYDNGPNPTLFVKMTEDRLAKKMLAVGAHTHDAQRSPTHPFSPASVETFARARGAMVAGVAAEAFHALRMLL